MREREREREREKERKRAISNVTVIILKYIKLFNRYIICNIIVFNLHTF